MHKSRVMYDSHTVGKTSDLRCERRVAAARRNREDSLTKDADATFASLDVKHTEYCRD